MSKPDKLLIFPVNTTKENRSKMKRLFFELREATGDNNSTILINSLELLKDKLGDTQCK